MTHTAVCAPLQSLHMLLTPEMYGLRRGTPEFERAAQELLQEAQLLWVLRHDNIVTLRGVTMHPEHGHVQWLVTERANGGSLEAWLANRGHMTLEDLLDLLRSVMQALVYMHSRTPSVLHRDIKPANVLVFTVHRGGIVWKLADVGIAKVLQSTLRAHTGAGTPMYTALDVYAGPYDGRVDVFSTGIMAAELVVRHVDIAGFKRVAADAYSLPEHRLSLVEDACTRLDTICPALSAVVRGCSAIKAKHRMSSDVALRALQDVAIVAEAATSAASATSTASASAAFAAAASPPPPPSPPVGGGGGGGVGGSVSDVVDMSVADDAMGELGIDREVSDRVCDAMVLAADSNGKIPGAQFLQMVVDEGVRPSVAMKLRQRLGITAGVPPRKVRHGPVLFVSVSALRCAVPSLIVRVPSRVLSGPSRVVPCRSCVLSCYRL